MKCTHVFKVMLFVLVSVPSIAAEHNRITILGEFGGSAGCDKLVTSGTNLYGMTTGVLSGGEGGVFKINFDGSGYTKLHTFHGGTNPVGSLNLSGSTLYGMVQKEGKEYSSALFKVNTDGGGFRILHTFDGGKNNGQSPCGSLTVSGSSIYGVTSSGGHADCGVVYRLNTDGDDFTILHSFNKDAADGEHPCGAVTMSGTSLYGMTKEGGNIEPGLGIAAGVIYKMNADGSGFTVLHTFGKYGDQGGREPIGSLTAFGSTLYGMTREGGKNDCGILFRVSTNGSGFTNLHSFLSGNFDGMWPYGSLFLSGSTLYGVTEHAGGRDGGTLFKINCDGSGYTNLHSFASSSEVRHNHEVGKPDGGMVPSGTSFYGVTHGVRKFGVPSVLFKLDIAP